MKTRKRSYAARLGILAVALALTSTCLLGGTMAKYATEVTGTGSATVAAWSFKANGKTDTFAVDLAKTAYTNIDNTGGNKIAPGTEGSFDVKLDASGSDVAVDYSIEFSKPTNVPAGLKFYSDSGFGTEIAVASGSVTGMIAADAADKTATKTIYWKWPFTTNDAGDTADTTVGKDAKAVSIDIKVTGTQVKPATS